MNLEKAGPVRYDIDFGSIPVQQPAPRVDTRAPMFAAIDGRAASLSNNECVFQPRDSHALHVMTHQVLQALDQCREFRPLDEHVARITGVIPGLSGQGEAVRRVLTGLIDRGLLKSDADFLASLADATRREPAPLKALAIRCSNRPALAQRLLASLREHGRRFERRDTVVLIDDSTDRDAARAHARMVETDIAGGGTASYVGRDEVRALVERLGKAVPAARGVLPRLLLEPGRNGFGGGRGYNVALLLAAGGTLSLLDDDYHLPFHRAHGARDGLDPAQSTRFGVRFLDSQQDALDDGELLAEDGFRLQQQLVGASLGAAIGSHTALRLDREQLRGQPLSRLGHLRGDARILASYTGSRGASFTSDSAWLYDLDPASRAGFWRDRDSYLRNVHAEAIVHAPQHTLVRPFGLFTPFLLDNSELLPCTAPSGRGEDGLFGTVASYVYPDSQTVHLPITIGHVQEGRRPRYERAMRALTPGINRFLREWVRNNAQPAHSADAGARLALLAAQLEDLAHAPPAKRVDILVEYLRYVRADLIDRLQQQLGAASDAPVYWLADARRIVEENGKALLANDPPRLDEWPDSVDADGCAALLRDACLELAEGYRHWPALWRTAAELGDRLRTG